MSVQVEDVVACVPNLRRFARRLNPGAEPVDDLVQETLTRALGALDRYQPTSDLKAWLFTIMKNYVRDLWRKQRNMATVSLSQSDDIDTRSAAAPQIDRLLLRELAVAIDRLPAYQRDVLIQVSIDPSSYEAASAALGIPVGTVRSRLFRARNSLHRLVDDDAPRRRNRRRAALN
ncbi:MAG: sigma-70 family RNA polymerase sigma factor [Pseudomonadota bacterium]